MILGMSIRDDFAEPIKRRMAARVGYRCSNPTCRRSTSRPHPSNSVAAISTGVAAHITAASPGGPRFDPALSPEQRSSIENGIWLCQICAKVIDGAADLYSPDLLHYWRRDAERQAALAARTGPDEISEIQADIDKAHGVLLSFIARWEASDPAMFTARVEREDWEAYTQSILKYSVERRNAYQKEVAPVITAALSRCRVVLGESDPVLQNVEREAVGAPTNYISMRMFADELQRLRSVLDLR
jgi:hypothetical protein